jgi:MFS superfamily sulfate permease-like transporter
VIRNLDDAVWASALFGTATLVIVLAMERFVPAIPGALVAVVGSNCSW